MQPALSPEEEELSAHVARCLAARISAAGGWISFAEFMQAALYEPGLGYYARAERAFGVEGDFVTAPEITPLFGRVIADALAEQVARTRLVIEFGAGSGALAEDLVTRWSELGIGAIRYGIIEVSPGLAAKQQQRLKPLEARYPVAFTWLEKIPEASAAVLICNELLDTFPVHLIVTCGADTWERGVVLQAASGGVGGGPIFGWADRPLTPELAAAIEPLGLPRGPEPYLAEIPAGLGDWVAEVAAKLVAPSLWLIIDYGYGHDRYAPFRSSGTLVGYFRHRLIYDPLWAPGLVDLTSFVDFASLQRFLAAAGLEVTYWGTQAAFLLEHGLLEHLAERQSGGELAYLRAARAVERLIMPHEMGELCKVLIAERR